MTGHQINSLVGDLVAMAQAMERLPQVEAELANANHAIALLESDKQSLWDDLEQSKKYNASLEQKVHDAEVAKDAAETMFLEADDRTARALDFVKAQFGAAGSLIQALEPPRVEPVVEQTVREEIILSEVKPIQTDSIGREIDPDWKQDKAETSLLLPQGQSEPDPTSVEHSNTDTLTEQSLTSDASQAPSPSWADPSTPKPQPYDGIRYQDWPKYVSLLDWIEGGGTESGYYYGREWDCPTSKEA